EDLFARIWHAGTGKLLQKLEHSGQVCCVCYLLDGKHVATASMFGTVHIWNLENGKVAGQFSTAPDYVTSIRPSADGKTLRVRVRGKETKTQHWDLTSNKQLPVVESPIDKAIAISKDRKQFLTNVRGSDEGIRVHDAVSGKEI